MTDSNCVCVSVCALCTVRARRQFQGSAVQFGNYRVALTCSAHGFMALLLQGLLDCSPSHQKNQDWPQQPARLATDRHASHHHLVTHNTPAMPIKFRKRQPLKAMPKCTLSSVLKHADPARIFSPICKSITSPRQNHYEAEQGHLSLKIPMGSKVFYELIKDKNNLVPSFPGSYYI